ncbi:uncharacterized protein MONBRDRAFT_38570, partial [Monosiga brevicollis MX1]
MAKRTHGQRHGGGGGGGGSGGRREQLVAHGTVAPIEEYGAAFDLVLDHPVQETDVGIDAFVCPDQEGFHAVIKQRYSDFLVNEIDQNERVVTLRSTAATIADEDTLDPDIIGLPQLMPMASLQAIQDLDQGRPDVNAILILRPIAEKQKRRDVHSAIRSTCPNLLTCVRKVFPAELLTHARVIEHEERANSSAVEDDPGAENDIVIMHLRGSLRPHIPDSNTGRHHTTAPYTHFTMVKVNQETVQCLTQLARAGKIKDSRLSFAGTKDRRAITVQRIAAERTPAIRIKGGADRSSADHITPPPPLLGTGIEVGDFADAKDGLSLGNLWGNRFRIVLRNVDGSPELMTKRLQSLREQGFINYFGLQRFGTYSVPSHAVGVAVLQGDYAAAIELLLM